MSASIDPTSKSALSSALPKTDTAQREPSAAGITVAGTSPSVSEKSCDGFDVSAALPPSPAPRTDKSPPGALKAHAMLAQGKDAVADAKNPLVAPGSFPRYAEITAADVVPAMRRALAQASQMLEALEAGPQPSWGGLMEPLERIQNTVGEPWGVVWHLMSVKNSPELRKAQETVEPEVTHFYTQLAQSEPIYQAMCSLRDSPEFSQLGATQQRVLQLAIQAAELSGVALEGPAQKRFQEITLELSVLATQMNNNLVDATNQSAFVVTELREVAGLPRRVLEQASNDAKETGVTASTPESGPWKLGVDGATYDIVMKTAQHRALRRRMFEAYLNRAGSGEHDNSPLLQKSLTLRAEQAELLGFNTYAEYNLATMMADSVESIESLHNDLRVGALPAAKRDAQAVRDFAKSRGAAEGDDFQAWDYAFWSERLREERFGLSDELVAPYLPFESALQGMFELSEKLFGVRIERAKNQPQVWNEHVHYFDVHDAAGHKLGGFYLDAFTRPEEKQGGAWMGGIVQRSRLMAKEGEDVRLPVANLVMNTPPPSGDKPATLTLYHLETLFHEFGHALHHILTEVDDPRVAGTNVEWDYVELPSQFLENFVYHPATLRKLTRHIESGEPMPDAMIQKIVEARTFQTGVQVVRQLNNATVDLELHHRYDASDKESPQDVYKRVTRETNILNVPEGHRFLNAFHHIFDGGYAAGYYSYHWAEVMSADAFKAFEEAGLDNDANVQALGRRFRDTVLAQGGSAPATEVYQAFRGRQATADALLAAYGLG